MAGGIEPGQELAFEFGPFQLFPSRRLLRSGGERVRLGARAIELLIALVERAGEVLSREELEARVWPQVVVEETSLRVHMSALRRALRDGVDGARYITNVPGRGYGFVAPVRRMPAAEAMDPSAVSQQPTVASPLGQLPTRLSSIVGREAAIDTLVEQLDQRRLITVVGPGGIGKTTVALAAAERFVAMHPEHAVCFVDLSRINDAAHVPSSLAAAFGLADFPDDWIGTLAQLLGARPALLLLDSCEHVVDAVATAVAALLEHAPGLRLLATSREPVGVKPEWLFRLATLEVPPHAPAAGQALAFSAIRLFVERAGTRVEGFELSDNDAPLAAELCRRLDGLPLAIEIAAARLEQFGLRGLVEEVEAGFLHLKRGRRTGATRHEALSAMLDWSYQLLTPTEQAILRRISVFRSPFSLRSAIRVAGDEHVSASDVVNGLAGLRAKSLLNRVVFDEVVKHQLLEQTRAYALEKQRESDDEDAVRRRHALLVSDLLIEAQASWPTMAKRRWVTMHGSLVLAIRTALGWAFSPSGDPLIGASLIARCWPMARYLYLEDYEISIRRAIEALEQLDEPPLSLLVQLYLGVAAHMQERMGAGPATRAAYNHATDMALGSPSATHQIEAEIGQIQDALGGNDGPRALAAAGRMKALALAQHDEVAAVVADRLAAQALHFQGDHAQARRLALTVRNHAVQRAPLASLAGIVDHRVSMDILLARALWLTGLPEQAAAAARASLQEAEADSSLAVCQSLALAVCPIALWRGENDEALLHARELLSHAQKFSSGQWLYLARGYVDTAQARRLAGAEPATQPRRLDPVGSHPFGIDQLITLDAGLWHEDSLVRTRQGRAGWCAAEILRQQALRLWTTGPAQEADRLLRESLEIAEAQGALAWTLRTTTSLARLWHAQGRHEEAATSLMAARARFTEGADTADLRAADALLDELKALRQQAPR
ncbi:winged helix-turn-helix domain-containing protein [Paucibacter sp. R3-3]|uniref:Winged helix-turn-helix domain-containing protein n=1 Tax=Roseateles agri TaxID=3098619 RepID=A0ABU5DJ93_9BURK|nr:winged helix-turn-helix domain-containing protein [Paucibacter sp. R3-3]MDY0746351.1 winged helix-turn-helix domain-containing protein [Paucibacter sp. R3-3]